MVYAIVMSLDLFHYQYGQCASLGASPSSTQNQAGLPGSCPFYANLMASLLDCLNRPLYLRCALLRQYIGDVNKPWERSFQACHVPKLALVQF